ncbi:MAG: terpene cyclase/mutase family protein [Planctomycetes bacterium]|nr:terpene cyclase/mutase family protein [Planctomycetota bacterium]
MTRSRAAFVVLVLALISPAFLGAQSETRTAGDAAFEVLLTAPPPPRRPDGKLPEGWDEARLERADGLVVADERVTLHRLVERLRARPGAVEVLVRCESGSSVARLQAVARGVARIDEGRITVYFARVEPDAPRHRLSATDPERTVMDFDGVQIVTLGGAQPEDLDEEAEPGDEKLGEAERVAKWWERRNQRTIVAILDGSTLRVDGERFSGKADEAGIAELAARVKKTRDISRKAYLGLHQSTGITCDRLDEVYRCAEKAGVDRIFLQGEFGGFNILRLLGFGTLGDPAWLPGVIDNGLKALARSQKGDGSWAPGAGSDQSALGTTALAMLAFLGEFHSPEEGDYQREVGRAWEFIKSRQRANGSLAGREEGFSFDHVLGTLALIETCGLTGADEHQEAAERALAFMLRCRNERGLWGLVGADPHTDLVVSTWALMALRAAEDVGLEVPEEVAGKARSWLDKLAGADGLIGLDARGNPPTRVRGAVDPFYGRHQHSLTAIAALARSRAGAESAEDEKLVAAIGKVIESPPEDGDGNEPADLDYLYFGALLMNAEASPAWQVWQLGMESAVRGHFSSMKGGADGIRGLLAADPARVALLTCCLELSYRFSRNPSSGR